MSKTMAKQKRRDTAVKLDADIAFKAKIVASFEGVSLAEYLSALLKPIIDREYTAKIQQAAKKEVGK